MYEKQEQRHILLQPLSGALNLKARTSSLLGKLGIRRICDLLFHFPLSFTKRSIFPQHFEHDLNVVLRVNVVRVMMHSSPKKVFCQTDDKFLELVFFNPPSPFIKSKFTVGSAHIISGKLVQNNLVWQIHHPELIFNKEQICEFEPVYPLTYGLSSKQLHNYILKIFALDICVEEWIDDAFIKQNGWMSFMQALKILHTGEGSRDLACARLAYDEFAAYNMVISQLKNSKQQLGFQVNANKKLQKEVLQSLGFEITNGQEEALSQIEHNQQEPFMMRRLLQGDVGCGKTLVAMLTALNYLPYGGQSAIMAPTDLLARQHYEFFTKALTGRVNVALLTGKTKAKLRNAILAQLRDGEVHIIIGTHTLFQDMLEFHNLMFVVVDEQHRFGVMQREALLSKGKSPDLLAMSATPIPRSLQMSIFGDLDVSSITSKPKNRLPIMTSALSWTKIYELMSSLERQMTQGAKIYWICPLIEHDEESQVNYPTAAVQRYEMLKEHFGENVVGLVHGKMSAEQKDEEMLRFKSSGIQILVATTVIEVGIDVPDASIIVIENAEKFGLATLHQLRGRVGRGALQSYCFLLYGKYCTEVAKQRINIMRQSNDGFFIAEQDLALRGGGEITGTQQSGMLNFKFLDLHAHKKIIESYAASSPEKNNKLLAQLFGYVASRSG